MILAVILILVVLASVLFHLFSPWQATPIASNWGTIDDTLTITVAITGIFFVAITLFMAYAIIRYRHRKGSRAHYEPENKKLEWILIAVTTIGICGVLAPGLFVYGAFVKIPANALPLEAVGQQWRWSFRFPGEDGVLGKVDTSLISGKNPFGMDPNDPNGQDDRLVSSNQVHIPIGQPIKVLLRSKDVLHDFYVPDFRVKMDAVPGLVSHMWFTPTRTGEFEILCSELCGVGHYNMRGRVIVDDGDVWRKWLQEQPVFAQTLSLGTLSGLEGQGLDLAASQGCFACHSVDGGKSVGPGWKGLFGITEIFTDGSLIVVDAKYIRESILKPNSHIVKDYPPVMVPYTLSSEQLSALVAYIKSLKTDIDIAPAAEVPVQKEAPVKTGVPVKKTKSQIMPKTEEEQPPEPEAELDDSVAAGMQQEGLSEVGKRLAQTKGCLACHSITRHLKASPPVAIRGVQQALNG